MTLPTVSIIIPVYNAEKFIRGCLDSIIGQTLGDLEVILINDGSTDGSLKIIEEYAALDSRISYITQQNKGFGASRNLGIAMSKGEYITFLDADDWVEPDCYRSMCLTARKDNADMVIADYYVESFDSKEKVSSVYKHNFQRKDEFQYLLSVISNETTSFCWNKLYLRQVIDHYKIRFPVRGDIQYLEDYLFCVYAISSSNIISFIDQPYVHYVNHSLSTVNGYQPNLYNDLSAICDRCKVYFANHTANADIMYAINEALIKGAYTCVWNECKRTNRNTLHERLKIIGAMRRNETLVQAFKSMNTLNIMGLYRYIVIYLIMSGMCIPAYAIVYLRSMAANKQR
ncbi:MAG: glycosyltransferase family 2 protein [Armatimonadota bacterium]